MRNGVVGADALTLDSRYLPNDRMVRVGTAESALLEDSEHPPRRVRERPELLSPQTEEQILRSYEETGDPVARRITEDEQSPRVFGRCSEKPLVVWVAADDAVQHDHVCRLDAFRIGCDVEETPLRMVLDPGLAEEPHRLLVIRRRELEVDGAGGASLQKFDLYFADSATDLEDGRALDSVLLEKRNHPSRRFVEPLLSVALRGSSGQAWREKVVTAARVAAARHRPAA